MLQKILKLASLHKLTAAIIVIVIIGGGYFGYGALFKNKAAVRYVTAAVQKGTLTVSVSGSGQISASNQVDLKSEVSGDVVYVGAQNGQEVKSGTLLAQLDAREAQKSVRDATVNLESALLTLEKLKGPEGLAIPKNKEKAQDDLQKAYDDGFNTVANAFLDLPTVMSGIQDVLFTSEKSLGGGNQWNIDYYADAVKAYDEKALQYRDDVNVKYQEARKKYDQNFQDYKSASRYSDTATIEKLINETYDTAKTVAEAIKSANNLIQFYKDKLAERGLKPQAIADTHLATLNTYTGKTNTHLLSLLSIQNTIKSDKDAVLNADLDVKSQELSVKQRQNALLDAKEKLADYYIRAPFGGVVAKMNVKKGDSVSANTVVVTFITQQRTAEISLNEVDAAKVKVSQKTILTFDAIEGLSLTGQVAEIDAIGTVSQGVVTYNVKIVFDTQDERVKPGMSVSAAVITDAKQDVLLVPNSAVKSNGSGSYVEVLVGNTPQNQTVGTGLSNDTQTEIISGLNEGDKVVTQTIDANAVQSQTQQTTGFRLPGLGR